MTSVSVRATLTGRRNANKERKMDCQSAAREPTLIERVQTLEKKVDELQGRESNLSTRMVAVEAEVLRPDRPVPLDTPF